MQLPISVWRVTDGKTGHDNQSLGLVTALAERVEVENFTVKASAISWGKGYRLAEYEFRSPDLIVGCGRRCQWPLFMLKQWYGGKTIYLMRPRLPLFDLCIIPRHDNVKRSRDIIISDGALNTISRSDALDENQGLILIGGPSKHFSWAHETLLARVETLLSVSSIQWTLSDSRRTPKRTQAELSALSKVTYLSHKETAPDWIHQQLKRAGQVWVTCDSVSMIYEALTAGGHVGLINVPPKRRDRITRIADDLIAAGLVRTLADRKRPLLANTNTLAEANRCAAIIHQRFLSPILSV